MTPADIERMAREAFPGALEGTEACRAWWAAHAESLTRFAALVRREAITSPQAVAWIVRHRDDGPDTRPAVYFTAAEAEAHAAQFLPGVATVVALGDVAAVRRGALEEAARVLDGVDNYANPMTANDCAAAIRALPR